MSAEYPLHRGEIRAFRTTKHQIVTALAVRCIGENGGRALVIDGSARIDPYWMVRICKKYGYDEEEILKRTIVGRGFTAYQLENMVKDVRDIVETGGDISFLGLIDFSSRFQDDDMNDDEGVWLCSAGIKELKRTVDEFSLYCVVADRKPELFSDHRGESGG